MQPRILKVLGVSLLVSALVMLGVAEFVRAPGRELVVVVLRIFAILDAVLGLAFFLLSLRKPDRVRRQ